MFILLLSAIHLWLFLPGEQISFITCSYGFEIGGKPTISEKQKNISHSALNLFPDRCQQSLSAHYPPVNRPHCLYGLKPHILHANLQVKLMQADF